MMIYHIKVRTTYGVDYGFIRDDQLQKLLQGEDFYILHNYKPSARTFIKHELIVSYTYFPVVRKKWLHRWDNEKFD